MGATESTQRFRIEHAEFKVGRTISRGEFGKMVILFDEVSKDIFALKTFKKSRLAQAGAIGDVLRERESLIRYESNEMFLPLLFALQNDEDLFFLFPFLGGGNLRFHLDHFQTFPEDLVCFYAAQIILILDYLHSHDIIYRNLNPENLLLDKKGYLFLCNFFNARELDSYQTANDVVGQISYMAPEIAKGEKYGKEVDAWSLGVVLFELLTGSLPLSKVETLEELKEVEHSGALFTLQMFELSDPVIELVSSLLEVDPQKRMTFSQARSHKAFEDIDFSALQNRTCQPPFVPENQANFIGMFDFIEEIEASSRDPNEIHPPPDKTSEEVQQALAQLESWNWISPKFTNLLTIPKPSSSPEVYITLEEDPTEGDSEDGSGDSKLSVESQIGFFYPHIQPPPPSFFQSLRNFMCL